MKTDESHDESDVGTFILYVCVYVCSSIKMPLIGECCYHGDGKDRYLPVKRCYFFHDVINHVDVEDGGYSYIDG